MNRWVVHILRLEIKRYIRLTNLIPPRLGYKNVIASDIDDLRTGDIPIIFKGYNFITLKLVCHDTEQLEAQMRNRPNGGLKDYNLQRNLNEKNLKRPLLINEIEIDVTGLRENDVLQKAIDSIESTESLLEYDYKKPPKEMFYSYVCSHRLR